MRATRRTGRRRHALALAVLLGPVFGAAAADPASLRRYGGVLGRQCDDVAAPRMKYLDDALVVEQNGRELLRARRVEPAPAPAGHEAAVRAGLPGGETLVFMYSRRADGLYGTVDASPDARRKVPAELLQGVRHCDPNRHDAAPGAAATSPAGPSSLLLDARLRQRYLKALGRWADQPWLARMNGPAPPLRDVTIGGTSYRLASVCKPHDCERNNAVLLFPRDGGAIVGVVHADGRHAATFGEPSAAMTQALMSLWAAEWKGGPATGGR